MQINLNGKEFQIVKSTYRNNGATYLGLIDKTEEEFYADITVNLEFGNSKSVIALDADFKEYADVKLLEIVKETLFEDFIGLMPQGFQMYELYTLKEGILDQIQEMK